MKFEWDSSKSQLNRRKHGIDFETAKILWSDENRVEIHAPHPVEDREILIAKHFDKIWAAIYTMRGDTIRIISVRRARKKEVDLYEEKGIGQEQRRTRSPL
ncbi:MAG: BrnT family toxin [Desulfobacterales bacterium]|jgi:uncharacterized DUF497 family protein|nr:BrnT family toxin [Desulfobacterales bacterium]